MFQHIAGFYNSQVLTNRYSSLSPHVAMRCGPYLHPSASQRELCIWPLRIPNPSTSAMIVLIAHADACRLGSSELLNDEGFARCPQLKDAGLTGQAQ